MSAITMQTDQPGSGLRNLGRGVFALLDRFPDGVLLLLARIAPAAVFFKSGLNKTDNWDSTLDLFANEYKVPVLPTELAAYLGTAAELACPVLLLLGLGARFGAMALLGMTFVIQTFVYPMNYA
jgi:putative oxidoreductase